MKLVRRSADNAFKSGRLLAMLVKKSYLIIKVKSENLMFLIIKESSFLIFTVFFIEISCY